MALGRSSLSVASLAVALGLLGAPFDACAQQAKKNDAPRPRSKVPVPGLYAYTNQPLWQVGEADKKLSLLCQKGEFNQSQRYRWIIGYEGKKGGGVTGMASSAWNLYDPYKLAQADRTYHFYNDGFSNCRVFSAKLKGAGGRR